MADYNASELVAGGDFGPTPVIVGAIGGGVNFTPSIAGTTGGSPVPVGAYDFFEIHPIKYRMRGYYTGGSTYEFWVVSNPNSPNPSGNPLVNVVIDTIFIQ